MYPAAALPIISERSTPRLTIHGWPGLATSSGRATGMMAALISGEVIVVGLFAPDNLLVVLERQRRHVAGNGGLLADQRRRDHFLLALYGANEISEVIDGAVA